MISSKDMPLNNKMPRIYYPGNKVRDIYTGEIFTVKDCYKQQYCGMACGFDYTVVFEPTKTQPTPWNKSTNLQPVKE